MKTRQPASAAGEPARIRQAEARAGQAEARTEQARTRAEAAETRTEQAETRTDLAKTRTEQAESRTEQAESRTEQAETAMQNLVHREAILHSEIPARRLKDISAPETSAWEVPLQRLTIRQREILQLIAEGQNTKQIGGILNVSPKTVEYHRMKLMAGLDLHDIPGLVRFALRAGLIPPGS
jgi:DNA-binding CsgD family transcriptional regulator